MNLDAKIAEVKQKEWKRWGLFNPNGHNRTEQGLFFMLEDIDKSTFLVTSIFRILWQLGINS